MCLCAMEGWRAIVGHDDGLACLPNPFPSCNDNHQHQPQVEGLYKNFGDLCPLQELVALKKRYCYRLYLDQTYSFGTLGATG